MKIEIRRETFLESFAIVGSVAPSRSTKPVLENIRIEATPAFTILLATNNEVGMRLEAVDVKVIQPGVALLPVSRVLPLLRETKDETLTIELNGDRIVIRGHQTKVTLQARDPDEFPPVASFDEEAYLTIRAGVLKRMLRRTVFATDNESSRFALGGVLLEFGSGELVAVATDGRRLAKMSGAAEKVGEPTTETMTIVPTAAISLLEKSLPDDDSPVHLAPRSNDILVRCGRQRLGLAHPAAQVLGELSDLVGAAERLVEAPLSDDDAGAMLGQRVAVILEVHRSRPQIHFVGRPGEVADDQAIARKARVQERLERVQVLHPLGDGSAHDHHAVVRSDRQIRRFGSQRWFAAEQQEQTDDPSGRRSAGTRRTKRLEANHEAHTLLSVNRAG